MMPLAQILSNFSIPNQEWQITPLKGGLINESYTVANHDGHSLYLLQKINTKVFPNPLLIANNVNNVYSHLQTVAPKYFFIHYIPTHYHQPLHTHHDGTAWRLQPFVQHTFSINIATNAKQVYQTAYKFGEFTALLNNADMDTVVHVLPGFHDLVARYAQFDKALLIHHERATMAAPLIQYLQSQYSLVTMYAKLVEQNILPLRIIHADAKIGNVLFNKTDGLPCCIVDYDTIMPGYVISDIGDMIRSMACSANEESNDIESLHIIPGYYDAIVNGYMDAMGHILTHAELQIVHFSGKYIVYMQALRFITDFLMGDVYYKTNYALHNFMRAQNQCKLLQSLSDFLRNK